MGTLGESLSDPFRGSLIPSGRLLICRGVELLLELLSTTLSRVLESLPPVLMTPATLPPTGWGFLCADGLINLCATLCDVTKGTLVVVQPQVFHINRLAKDQLRDKPL